MCYRCHNEEYEPPIIQGYSYKPDPIFYGVSKVYFGAEIEVNSGDAESDARRASEWLGDLAYFKDDSSINGFEIVTHPMSYEHAMEKFPWQVLAELDDAGCNVDDGTGVHIHVSRAGFDGAPHVYRWMKLFYRNRREVTRIAGRTSHWAAFRNYDQQMQYATAHDGGKMLRYAARKGDSYFYPARYCAINVQNSETFEVRIFESTLDAETMRAYLALCAASVEYTRNLTVQAIRNGGWTWRAFADWVKTRDEYAPLAAVLR